MATIDTSNQTVVHQQGATSVSAIGTPTTPRNQVSVATAAARAALAPAFAGQLLYQADNESLWIGDSTAVGDWSPGASTAVVANAAARALATPLFAGQVMVQLDPLTSWMAASTTAGDWTATSAPAYASDIDDFLAAANDAAARVELDLEIGVDVQAYTAVLAATTASFLAADRTKLDAIEDLADVTDVTNVTAAGAVMVSGPLGVPSSGDLSNCDSLQVSGGGTGGTTAAGARTALGLAIGTNVQAWAAVLDATTASFLAADRTKLDGIEDLADVTSTANITAAGGLISGGDLGTPSAGVLTSCTGLPASGLTSITSSNAQDKVAIAHDSDGLTAGDLVFWDANGNLTSSTLQYTTLLPAGTPQFKALTLDGTAATDIRLDLETSGVLGVRLGDNSGYGSLRAETIGVTAYERHLQLTAMLSGTPAAQPTAGTYGTAGGLIFASSGAEYAYIQWEVPGDWDGTDVYIEIDWIPFSAGITGTDTIKWDVNYHSIAEGEVIDLGTVKTLTDTDSTDYPQGTTKHTRFTMPFGDANQPLVPQDHVYFQVTRDTGVANDFAGTVMITSFEIIYNSVGIPTSN